MWHVWGRGGIYAEVLWGNLKDEDHFKDLGVNGKIIYLQDMRSGMDRIDSPQGRDRWRAVMNARINFSPPYDAGKFLTS
jgi:hypothetical protein